MTLNRTDFRGGRLLMYFHSDRAIQLSIIKDYLEPKTFSAYTVRTAFKMYRKKIVNPFAK